jgi:hypothetical protein
VRFPSHHPLRGIRCTGSGRSTGKGSAHGKDSAQGGGRLVHRQRHGPRAPASSRSSRCPVDWPMPLPMHKSDKTCGCDVTGQIKYEKLLTCPFRIKNINLNLLWVPPNWYLLILWILSDELFVKNKHLKIFHIYIVFFKSIV